MWTMPSENNEFQVRFSAHSRHICLRKSQWLCPTHSLNKSIPITKPPPHPQLSSTQTRCVMNLQLRFFSSLVYILKNLLMFNANGGYLTNPYQAHLSVACMYRHIHRHLAHKICLIVQTIPEKAISISLQALHYLIRESLIRKLYV